jgi:uncharacterized protein
LIVFGLFNALVLMWMGDILLVYGIAAILLFPFRRTGPAGQIGWAAAIMAVMLLIGMSQYREAAAERAKVEQLASRAAAGQMLSAADAKLVEEQKSRDLRRSAMPAANPAVMERISKVDEARSTTFAAYWRHQRDGWKFLMTNFFWMIEAEILATMLIGMALFQLGVIQGRASRRTYALLVVVGYGIGLTLRGSLWVERLEFQPGLIWQRQFEDVGRLATTLGHLGLIHLALSSRVGRGLLAPFAAAGKIPLTIYLFTSFLMMWVVFAPWGFGMAGEWGQAQLAAVALLVIALELVAANLWVRRFENGPMEWLWKSLAYQQRQPFRRERPALAPLAAE